MIVSEYRKRKFVLYLVLAVVICWYDLFYYWFSCLAVLHTQSSELL